MHTHTYVATGLGIGRQCKQEFINNLVAYKSSELDALSLVFIQTTSR